MNKAQKVFLKRCVLTSVLFSNTKATVLFMHWKDIPILIANDYKQLMFTAVGFLADFYLVFIHGCFVQVGINAEAYLNKHAL